jgi:2-haloacid dehalogenase
MAQKLKAFVFDAYGTVFDVHSVVQLAEQFFPGKGQQLSQTWRSKQIEYMFIRSLMGRYIPHNENTEAALVYACKLLQLDCDAARRAQLMDAYLQLKPFPEAVAALESLAGYQRAILSVGTEPMLTKMVAHAGMTRHFDKLISVDAVKIYKPHPNAYQLVLDQLGVTKSEVGFVTSNYFDVAGAKSFGFKVFWINRANLVPDELGVTPDEVLSNLTDLKQFS